MSRVFSSAALVLAFAHASASAATFVNGGFETGNATGWNDVSSAYRGGILNSSLTPGFVISNEGSGPQHSAIINTAYVDPHVPVGLLGTTVYSGNFSWRVEDTTIGGYASLIQQQVNNYTDPDIFFAWKALLEGAHGVTDAATIKIVLRDVTAGVDIITREYNAASGGSGVDARFSYYAPSNYYYTPDWQIEQLTLTAAQQGHDFLISVLASDCQPTGHAGYVYLDGFGSVTPPAGNVPEPTTCAIWGLGSLGLCFAGYRRRLKKV